MPRSPNSRQKNSAASKSSKKSRPMKRTGSPSPKRTPTWSNRPTKAGRRPAKTEATPRSTKSGSKKRRRSKAWKKRSKKPKRSNGRALTKSRITEGAPGQVPSLCLGTGNAGSGARFEGLFRTVLRLPHHGRTLLGSLRRVPAEPADLPRGGDHRAHLGARARGDPADAGEKIAALPLPDDRLHRRPAGDPPADHHPGDLGRRPLPHLPAERHPHPRVVRQAGPILVRGGGSGLRLWRLHGRGLPGRDRSGAERPDGGGALARDEPFAGDAPHRRPPGRHQS